jgi:hypothetical protein
MSMLLGVMIYFLMWMISEDGIKERQELEKANKYSIVIIDETHTGVLNNDHKNKGKGKARKSIIQLG